MPRNEDVKGDFVDRICHNNGDMMIMKSFHRLRVIIQHHVSSVRAIVDAFVVDRPPSALYHSLTCSSKRQLAIRTCSGAMYQVCYFDSSSSTTFKYSSHQLHWLSRILSQDRRAAERRAHQSNRKLNQLVQPKHTNQIRDLMRSQ